MELRTEIQRVYSITIYSASTWTHGSEGAPEVPPDDVLYVESSHEGIALEEEKKR
jgi:hypothetical protein